METNRRNLYVIATFFLILKNCVYFYLILISDHKGFLRTPSCSVELCWEVVALLPRNSLTFV